MWRKIISVLQNRTKGKKKVWMANECYEKALPGLSAGPIGDMVLNQRGVSTFCSVRFGRMCTQQSHSNAEQNKRRARLDSIWILELFVCSENTRTRQDRLSIWIIWSHTFMIAVFALLNRALIASLLHSLPHDVKLPSHLGSDFICPNVGEAFHFLAATKLTLFLLSSWRCPTMQTMKRRCKVARKAFRGCVLLFRFTTMQCEFKAMVSGTKLNVSGVKAPHESRRRSNEMIVVWTNNCFCTKAADCGLRIKLRIV